MSRRPIVAVSISDAPRQAELGFGKEHLEETLVRVARFCLRRGCDLANGGDLRPDGYTTLLADVVRAEIDVSQVGEEPEDRSEKFRRLSIWLCGTKRATLSVDQRARWLAFCRFVFVPEDSPALDPLDRLLADPIAYSMMRRAMVVGGATDLERRKVDAIKARIVLGGKLDGYSGFMPGILEEVAWSARAVDPHPIFLLGGFGGAAGALARGIVERALPAVLDPDRVPPAAAVARRIAQLESERSALVNDAIALRLHPKEHLLEIRALCAAGVAGLAERCRMHRADCEIMLTSGDVAEVLRVLARSEFFAR